MEGGLHTLSNMSEMAQKASENYLKLLGVHVKTNVIVKNYDGKMVTLNNGECIKSKHVIWTAGVTGNIISGIDEKQIVNNRIKVDRYNLAQGYSNIYAVGDIAYMETPAYPKGRVAVSSI